MKVDTPVWQPNRDLPYHERWDQAVAEDVILDIVVPRHASVLIAPASGIVAQVDDDPVYALCYFEGWTHGQHDDKPVPERWRLAVENAASRMVCRYPTVAMSRMPRNELRKIGTYSVATKAIRMDHSGLAVHALNEWLDQ